MTDPLSSVLSLLKPESYAFRGLDASGSWAISFPAEEGIKCYSLRSGSCWLIMDGVEAPVHFAAGDCILLPHSTPFRLCTALDVPTVDAVPFFTAVGIGEFARINGGGECSGIGGYFSFASGHSDLLLNKLPPIVHFRREEDKAALHFYLERLMQELRDPQPGGALITEHLMLTLLVHALRLHIADSSSKGVGWLFALRDRQMNAAIAAMHAEPGRRWTLSTLAAVAGMSRSSFAARFTATVGEPAIEYLTRWRMHLAADRLENLGTPVSVLSNELGYESESAFGAAFKRIIGQSPRQYTNRIEG